MLRPEAEEALRGVDRIIHAGDVGRPIILDVLEAIAPVTAVRGNTDTGGWAWDLPETEVVEAGDLLFYVLHDLRRLDLDPAAAGFCGVIYGHSHRPYEELREGVLYLNPGSAGPRRMRIPASLALVDIEEGRYRTQFIQLD
ncbi:MAG: metallophosphoesterase family protein [Deltaproteobacteria bacterium]|nr:metallophosphoesterase family protein [Deltaproteobacteria bacterium]